DTNRTTYTYEAAISRLSSIKDPGSSAATQYTYDKADRIKTVTHSGSIATSFQYNAFGELARENSPDRGTTLYFYDRASRLIRKEYYAYTTGSPGALLQADKFTHDSLNRLATIDFGNDSNVDRVYEYDLADHSYSKGRLSRIKGYAANGTTLQYQMDYHYDNAGNVAQYHLTQDGVTYITTFGWDEENNLVSITYPDGFGVRYDYVNGRLTDVRTQLTPASQYHILA